MLYQYFPDFNEVNNLHVCFQTSVLPSQGPTDLTFDMNAEAEPIPDMDDNASDLPPDMADFPMGDDDDDNGGIFIEYLYTLCLSLCISSLSHIS